MKRKSKLFKLTSSTLLSASAIAPAVFTTSCSKENDPMAEPLKEETIDKFKEIVKVNRPSNMPEDGEQKNLSGIRKYCRETIKSLGLSCVDQGDAIYDESTPEPK